MTGKDLLELERAAVGIARRKLDAADSTDIITRPRLGTGGHFKDLFLWDTAFTAIWALHADAGLPVENSLDNFYRLAGDDGFIYRQYLPSGSPKFILPHPICWAPPILSWAEWTYWEMKADRDRLTRVYPVLKKHHRACQNHFRQEDGLYTGCPLGCGMDNLPRWPQGWADDGKGIKFSRAHCSPETVFNEWMKKYLAADNYAWNLQGRYIDMSSQMALDARLLSGMADILGHDADKEEFGAEHRTLGGLINNRMWHDELGAYVDLGFGRPIPRLHIGGFWPLIAGIVPEERVSRLADLLRDERHFYRPTPVPSLAASDPAYVEKGGDYWLGGVWAPTNYMVFSGLALAGEKELARDLAERFTRSVWNAYQETGTLWENYDPEGPRKGGRASPDFCGWTGLAAVSIPRQFLS